MTQLGTAEPLLTGEELLTRGDLGPCELVDGRVVPMVPVGGEHARIESLLAAALTVFVDPRSAGWVMVGEVGIYTGRRPDRVRGADLAFLSRQRAPEGPPSGFLEGAPDLVVEIVSPGDRWQDLQGKIEEYFEAGVERIWVVSPAHRTVLVYASPVQLRRLAEGDALEGEGPLAGFTLAVSALFPGAALTKAEVEPIEP